MREQEGQPVGQPDFNPRETQRIPRPISGLHTTKTLIIAVIIAAVVMAAAGFYIIHLTGGENDALKQQLAATSAKEKAASEELAAKKKLEEVQIRAEQEAAKAKAALPTIGGTFAVVTSTLFKTGQRPEAAAKSVVAFDTCKYKDQPLSLCFVEVGKKTTEVIAVPKIPMTELEATALAKCFDDNIPKLDSGESVGAFAQNLESKRYAGKSCITAQP